MTAALGVGLMAAPAVFGFVGTGAEWSMRIAGPIVATFSITAWWQVLRGMRWINIGAGAWLLVAPLVIDHPSAAVWVSLSAGLAVLALSPWRGPITYRFGGGWKVLWRGGSAEEADPDTT